MNRYLFVLLTLLLGCFSLNAQTGTEPSTNPNVDADPRVQQLVEKHVEVNSRGKAKGYRVQIYFGSDKTQAKEVKARFLSAHGQEARAYEPYEQPNFKIRVGDFRTRLEAYRFMKLVKAEFPTAFIVESDIEIPESE